LRIREGQVTQQLTKKTAKKTNPKVKLPKITVNIVLTMNYEEQQKPGKKTKPIFWSKSLILSEKSMIPNYKKYAKRTQSSQNLNIFN